MRSWCIGLGVLVLGVCGDGNSVAASSTQTDSAGLVDIDGRKMYLECKGQGSPTVVLVSGLPIAGDLWDSPLGKSPTVFPSVAKVTHVCSYDRPGSTRAQPGGGDSRSDPVLQPTTTKDAVADLHALLLASQQTGPYVLVGHSYGGIVSRLYANTYPTEVAGMVLVDSFSPELQDNMSAQDWPTWKLTNVVNTPSALADYPDLEWIDYDVALQQVRAAKSIPPMPLIVLTADEPADTSGKPGVPPDFGTTITRAHQAAQKQVAQLVPGAKHVTDTHSGHNMMVEQPQLVTDAVIEVVEAVRQGRTAITE